MLENLLKTAEIQDLFESFYKLIRIPLAIIDLDANVLLSSRWQRICMQYYRVNPTTCERCIQSDKTLTSHIEAGQTYAMSRCPNGLTDCASPIVFDGQHVANVFIGEFLTDPPDQAWFASQADEFGFDREDFLAALAEVPIVDASTISHILDLLSQMTRVVTNLSVDRKRALDERTRQKLILDTIPQAVFWKDAEGKYLGCNAVFAEAIGLAPSESVVGKTDFDLPWPRESADAYRADDQEVISTGLSKLHIVEQIDRHDGSRIVADTSKVPLTAGEKPYGVLGVYSDITDRVRADEMLRDSEERFRTAFMAGSDAYVIVGRDDGRIVEVNDRFLEMYGFTREECVGHVSLDLGVWARPEQREEVLAELARSGRVHDYEVLGRRKNGETFPVLYSVSPLRERDGSPLLFGTIHDLTEQYRANQILKRSEDALREQNAFFRAAFVTGADAYVLATLEEGRVIECGDQFLEMFGLTREETIGRTTRELGLWARPECRAEIVAKLKAHGRVQDIEISGIRRSGQTFYASYSGSTLAVPGQPPLLMVALRDITERKAAEERIRALTRLLRTISEINELIVREHDRGRLLAEACRILVERGEFRMAWIGLTDPESGAVRPVASAGVDDGYLAQADIRSDDSERGRGPAGTSIREGRVVVVDDWQNDSTVGPWRDAAVSRDFRSSAAFPLEMRGRVVGALTTYASETGFFNEDVVVLLEELAADVSYALNALDVEAEKRAAEEALHASEERFRRIVETSAEGIWVVDSDSRTTYVNRRTAEILGCEPEDLIGHDFAEFVNAEGNLEDESQTRARRDRARYTQRFRRKDGPLVDCEVSAVPVHDDSGVFRGSFAMLTDVTDRMASERHIRRLAAAVGELTEGIVITDARGDVEYTNPAFTRLTGRTRAEVLGRNWFALVSEHQADDVHEEMLRTIQRGDTWQGQFKHTRKDGTVLEEEVTISPVHDRHGEIVNFVAVKRDVTKERSLVAQLNQAQKMEAIGTLAGGVAHDFNNLLQGMIMMLQVAKRPDKVATALAEVDKLVRRGSALTKQLLLFSRKEVAKPELLDLSAIIRDAAKLLRRLLRENITFAIDLENELLPVTVDRSQMEQAVMNLVVNAADAMPEGGLLRIVTSSSADRCVLSVEDTGHGVPIEIRDRLFEPFFTTKGREKGTGLGLPVVHGIVMEHGGTISFEDRPGGGTRFTISLPRAALGEGTVPRFDASESAVPRGSGERVLVIEDEDAVRAGVVALLESLDYRTTAVSTGEAALELPASPPFDVVLSDVVLPGRPGPDVTRDLVRRWPAAKVVLMSGYTSDPVTRAAVASGELTLLEKPFDAVTLAAALRAALHREATAVR